MTIAHGVQCHDQLAGFGSGHPGAVVNTADAETVDDEITPPARDPVVGGRAANSAGKNRVVPVHRVSRLLGERIGVGGDRVAQSADRDLPFRLRLVDKIGQSQRAPDAVKRAGTSGQQGLVEHAVGPLRPVDLTGAGLKIQHKVDRAAHGGPHPFGEGAVAGDQHVMPHSGGDVGAEVTVAVRVFDDASAVLNRPGSVAALAGPTPLVGCAGLLDQTGGSQCHRALDVVPRIGMAGDRPGNLPGGQLDCRDRLSRLAALCRREYSGDTRDAVDIRPVHRY